MKELVPMYVAYIWQLLRIWVWCSVYGGLLWVRRNQMENDIFTKYRGLAGLVWVGAGQQRTS